MTQTGVKMRQTLAMLAIAICMSTVMTPEAAHGQQPGAVAENARVRVIDQSCLCPPRHGRVLTSWGDSALVELEEGALAKSDTAAPIRAFHIANLLVWHGYETHVLRGMKNGAMYGTLAGAAVGFAIGHTSCNPRLFCFTRLEAAGLVALPGLVFGTAIGGFIGGQARERWLPATAAQRVGMTVTPSAYSRGVTVGGTIAF